MRFDTVNTPRNRRARRGLVTAAAAALLVAACGSDSATTDEAAPADTGAPAASESTETLRVGAIPDQDIEKLNRMHGLVSGYLSEALGVDVEYVPVTEYSAAVGQFRTGDLDLVWFGSVTGVQARLETPGAEVLAQRDIDTQFQSVFIANTDVGIEPFDTVEGLTALAGTRITFGSESSTSGRLMPQAFLNEAGLTLDDFEGEPGFSGSHDKTIELVASGTYEVGAVSKSTWDSRVESGEVDLEQVKLLFETPTYNNYHWVGGPTIEDKFGAGFSDEIVAALLAIDGDTPEEAELLELFDAGSFIETSVENYTLVENIGRELGLIN